MELNIQQQRAIDLVKEGKNVFVTGSAGVGKSLIISLIKEWADENDKIVSVTAMTGVAAANINGSTLHAWGGIGLGKSEPRKHAYYIKRNENTLTRYLETDILIVDEISMADYEYINTLNSVAQFVRKDTRKSFGGIQIVFCGDFYQLGPVQKNKTTKFLFEDLIWDRIIDQSVHLTQVYRQSKSEFVDILHRIRVGDVDDAIIKRINETSKHVLKNENGIEPTTLFCRNMDVDRINTRRLATLEGETKSFDKKDYFESDDYKKLYEKSFTLPNKLELKINAQVMLLINLDIENGLVNGSRGVVTDITEEGIKVKFRNGLEQIIKPYTQAFKDDNSKMDDPDRAYRIQYPLRLAYALTVHKSQSLSIDYLEIDLNGCFTSGQAYVALSRATSFDTLRVKNFRKKCVIVSDAVKKFYKELDNNKGGKRKLDGPLDKLFKKQKVA